MEWVCHHGLMESLRCVKSGAVVYTVAFESIFAGRTSLRGSVKCLESIEAGRDRTRSMRWSSIR
ncbi:hypothetical protein STPYR_10442 [uncultured Stenotrophomonas sp.]|uniref:Uncharacterized protein n=1 Tax=uncultured Stenotrophomonas sp. TaxID=165438 RepID=A0A1Y5PZR1_9GAMM|nr:hypothetical protein STPYR_10442 [uncultured Stenotrophomonas sp.]